MGANVERKAIVPPRLEKKKMERGKAMKGENKVRDESPEKAATKIQNKHIYKERARNP